MNILPNISVPKYRLTIPSTGENVEYRPYVVKEEKVLLIAITSEDPEQMQDAIVDIVQNCVKGIVDINTLTACDIEYIFLKLRSVSVGEKIEVVKTCEHCDTDNDININLNNIRIEKDKDTQLRVEVDNNFVIDMKYPTIGDNIIGDEDNLIKTVAKSIKVIYYGEETHPTEGISDADLLDFVGNLNSKQYSKLVSVLLDAPFVVYESKFNCKECGKENDIYFTGLIDFFI